MIRHEHRNFCILSLSKLSRHQLVKLGIAGKLVDKRHKRTADLEKPTVFVNHFLNSKNKFTRISGIKKEPYGSYVKNIK